MSRVVDASGRLDPILIGGPSRNGKTMLTGMIGAAATGYYGMPFELLLNVYMGDRAFSRAGRRRILDDYIGAPRAVTPDRAGALTPADFCDAVGIDALVDEAAGQGSVVGGIATILDHISAHNAERGWIGADYHGECDHACLRGRVPGLRLIVAMRDPVESVAASLYWRTYPDRLADDGTETAFRVALWNLAAATGLALAKRLPGEVLILDMNGLWRGEPDCVDGLARFLGCDASALASAAEVRPWFGRVGWGLFLCPDAAERPLLSEAEIRAVEAGTAPIRGALQAYGRRASAASTRLPVRWAAAARAPRAARHLIALRYRPRQRVARSVSRLKRALRRLMAS